MLVWYLKAYFKMIPSMSFSVYHSGSSYPSMVGMWRMSFNKPRNQNASNIRSFMLMSCSLSKVHWMYVRDICQVGSTPVLLLIFERFLRKDANLRLTNDFENTWHDTGVYSPSCHRVGAGSNPGHPMWNVWWTRWKWDRSPPPRVLLNSSVSYKVVEIYNFVNP